MMGFARSDLRGARCESELRFASELRIAISDLGFFDFQIVLD